MKETSMRDAFFDELYNIAKEDRRVILISADFGAASLDKFRRDLRGQFINVGIAEQNMISLAAGLALGGKLPFCYAIIPFATLRCLEQIKVDLCSMNLPVTLVGVGAGYAYDDSGPTHHGLEDLSVMRGLPNMAIVNASDSIMAASLAEIAYASPGPKYIRLDRTKDKIDRSWDFRLGLRNLHSIGNDVTIVATGYMVTKALRVVQGLTNHQVGARVVDLYRIKPVSELLLEQIEAAQRIVTLEEHFLNGGIGSIVAEIMIDNNIQRPLKRFGVPDSYSFKYGGREKLHKDCGLDVESITKGILEWIK